MAGKKVESSLVVRTPNQYTLEVKSGSGHGIVLDTSGVPGHQPQGMTPKEALLSAIIGCSTMDVIAWLGKRKVSYTAFSVHAESEQTDTHPKVFSEVNIVYDLQGVENVEQNVSHIKEAVDLSMSKFCGVSAMVSKTVPMFYTVRVNGEIEHRSQARFA